MTLFSARLREFLLDLLALVWPTACVHCGAADRDCCDECLGEVRGGRDEAAAPLRAGELSAGAPAAPGAVIPVFAAGEYDGPLRAVLVACKHDGRTGFAAPLGARLAVPLAEALRLPSGPGPPIVVCAPSRRSRHRERGYHHVELIVGRALRADGCRGGSAGRPWVLSALRAERGRSGQVGLRPAERERNARRVRVKRRCRGLLRGREVILVDDILTTGATLRGARECLEEAGARVVAAVVLCRVVRRDTRERADARERVERPASEALEFRQRRNGAPDRGHPPESHWRSPWK